MTTPNQQLAEPPDYSSPIAAELRDTFRWLDAGGPGFIVVLSRSITSPPADAPQGARFIVAEDALFDWAGHTRHVAYLTPEGWNFRPPRRGWFALVLDEGDDQGALLIYNGTEWESYTLDATDITFDGYSAGLDSTTVDAALEELITALSATQDDVDALEVVSADHEVRISILELGGGGGGGSSNVTPDTHPASPDAADDEFESGTSIDTTGGRRPGATAWAWRNQGSATSAIAQGSHVLTTPTGAGDNLRIVEQAFSGNGRFRARIGGLVNVASNYVGMGLSIAGGALITIGHYNAGRIVVRFNSETSGASAPYNVADDLFFGPVNSFCYFECEYTSPDVSFRISPTGVDGSFVTLLTEAASSFLGGAPTRVFLFANGNSAGTPAVNVCDWFRRMA